MGEDEYQALEVYEGEDKQHYWRLKAENGDIVAVGGEGYSSKANAFRGFAAASRIIVGMAGQKLQAQAEQEAKALDDEAATAAEREAAGAGGEA